MIKKFFSNVLGSFVGAWLALVVFSFASVFFSFAILGVFAEEASMGMTTVQDNSVLYLNLTGSFEEKSTGDEALKMLFEKKQDVSSSLDAVLKALRIGKEQDKIKGLFIETKGNSAGIATLYEIRQAIQDFKSSGKFVYAYGNEGITQGDYYVASVADSILLNPVGMVDIHGLSASIPFFKNLLDKIGVEMQVIRVGTFKSAVEPYVETEASPANRLATETYLKSIWGNMCDSISVSRSISVGELNKMADNMMMTQTAKYLLENT